MDARAALEEPADGGVELGPAGRRAQEEELVEPQLALEDVALGQPGAALDVQRGQHLTFEDDVRQVRRVLGERPDDGVPEGVALGVPVAAFAVQVVRRVLHEDGHDVLARGRHPGVDQRGDHHVEEGAPGEPPVLGVVVGALEGGAVGTDRDGAPEVRPGTGNRGEVGQRVERQVHLAGGALEPVAADRLDELAGQLLRVEHPEEGAARIHARGDLVGEHLLAALEHHPGGLPTARQDALDAGVRADLGAEAPGGARERLGDGAHPAALETPRPGGAVDLAHVVVEQHVGGPRRGDAQEGADDAARRHGGLQGVGLEPAVEVVAGARRHEPRELVEAPVPEAREVRGQFDEAAELPRADRAHPRGRHREQLPDPPAEVVHPEPEERVVVRVPAGELEQRLAGLRRVVPAGQGPSVRQGRERPVERLELQAVPGEVEVVDDLRPQQADHVGEDRDREPGQDLLAVGGPADALVLLDEQDVPAAPRQVGGGDQPVVAAPDDDVVVAVQGGRAGLFGGRGTRRARRPRDPIPVSPDIASKRRPERRPPAGIAATGRETHAMAFVSKCGPSILY